MEREILEDLGFTNVEITVYLTILEEGPTTSGPIIEKSRLQSSVVHRALVSLSKKGVINFVKKGKNKEYQSIEPKELLQFIENKRRRLLEILPELEAKKNKIKNKNETEMIIGKKAIFTALNNLILNGKRNEEYLSFSLIEPHNDPEIISFYKQHNLRRRERKLQVKVLVNIQVKGIYEKNYSKELLKKANVRYTSFHLPQGIVIFRDTVLLHTWEDTPTAIKITNNLISRQFKEFFLELYNKEKNAY